MHARLTLVPAGPGMRSAMERVADELAPIVRAQRGFKGLTFLFDDTHDTAGLYGALSLWESKPDAEAAGRVLDATIHEALARLRLGSSTTRPFEVYEAGA